MRERTRRIFSKLSIYPTLAVSIACLLALLLPLTIRSQSLPGAPTTLAGQTATKLADGRVLLLGGEGVSGGLNTAGIWDPRTNSTTTLPTTLNRARAWHTATMLPDGLVLVLGGTDQNRQIVTTAELFDPATQFFTVLPSSGVTPRAHHTATLLSDGNVLIVGGIGANGQVLQSAELWDALNPSSITISEPTSPRRDQTATLLADGRVLLWGGSDGAGNALNNGDLYHPVTGGFTGLQIFPSALVPQSADSPSLVASIPLDRSVDIDTESMISLRFSKPLRVETVNDKTVSLSRPSGLEKISVVPAENGSLAFLTPAEHLLSGATYTVTVNGAIDINGLALPVSGITFTTKGGGAIAQSPSTASTNNNSGLQQTAPVTPVVSTEPTTTPDGMVWLGKFKNGLPYSDWQDLPPLQAPPGVTALAGQSLDIFGQPLAHVKLSFESEYGKESKVVQTDDTGRFLLTGIKPGRGALLIDSRQGRNPNSGVQNPKWGYGVYEYGLEINKGETNVLKFTIWLTKIDADNAVPISSPTSNEVIVTSPRIPGLELRLPPTAEITDHEGKKVDQITLTQIPLDRTPFPLPPTEDVPIYFTAQPGGAYIKTSVGIGARIYYPNKVNREPGTRAVFWHYDPDYQGWYVYGKGRLNADGTQIIPDEGISIYELTGAMVDPAASGPATGPECRDPKCRGGDPVDLQTGLFVHEKIDLVVPNILPITLTRTYRNADSVSRQFGRGATHPYQLLLTGDTTSYSYMDMILADGGKVHFDRVSPGTGYADAVLEASKSPNFFGSRITWNGNGWDVTHKDGTIYVFGDVAPLQSIRDRYGNQILITRTNGQRGNITRILALPSGRWMDFTYDGANRIIQVKDNLTPPRTVGYEYDSDGRVWKVTDSMNGVTEYIYDSANRMTSIKDPRGNIYLTVEYDPAGRVVKQTQADASTYQISYTLTNGKVTQADVTDSRGNVRRVEFNTTGQITKNTDALGKPEEQVTIYERQAGTNLLLSVTDALVVNGQNRKTAYTYDAKGNVLTVTRMAQDPPNSVTTTYTYEPTFNQVATITDPLGTGHTTTFTYDSSGNLQTVEDPLGHQTTYTYNALGQPLTVTTPAGTTQFIYEFGDLVSVIDPMGNVTNRGLDAIGRLRTMTNPLGLTTSYGYDNLNRMTGVTDPLSGLTQFGYDPNSNLLSVSDAKTPAGVTGYTYDNMDRLQVRTDPLSKNESYVYDAAGNLTLFRDRKLQATVYGYDALNRRTNATYNDNSSTSYAYDKANRLTQISDSIAGSIVRTYDALDRLTSEQTPQGTVSYTYDAASRRATMTVPGQSLISYTYDNANRLTQITQGSSIVQFGYDNANRRTSLTLPNNIRVEYGYDAASRVTSITYKQNGTTVIGDLTYEYDKAGNRTKTGGSWARTGMAESIASAQYDAANRQSILDDKTLTYDDNGNVVTISDSNGTTLYTWNARGQLIAISGPNITANFTYDGVGRREARTVNGNLTEFLYDGVNPVQELSGVTVLANMVSGLGVDEYLTRTEMAAGTTSYFLTDILGSIIALTDLAGTVQTEYTYDVFGKTTATGASSTNSFQYTGRENDGTGLYYYRSRYYHPGLQRFITEDPLGFLGGINSFAYVNNNATRFVDPFGLAWTTPDFVRHYYTGGGSPVDLAQIGLLDAFRNSFSVAPIVSSFKALLQRRARAAAQSVCQSCDRGPKSFRFSAQDKSDYDVTSVPNLFSLGQGIVFGSADCGGVANCRAHTYQYSCNLAFRVRDWFRDPIDRGIEVGGTPYRINADWQEGASGSGSF